MYPNSDANVNNLLRPLPGAYLAMIGSQSCLCEHPRTIAKGGLEAGGTLTFAR